MRHACYILARLLASNRHALASVLSDMAFAWYANQREKPEQKDDSDIPLLDVYFSTFEGLLEDIARLRSGRSAGELVLPEFLRALACKIEQHQLANLQKFQVENPDFHPSVANLASEYEQLPFWRAAVDAGQIGGGDI